MLRRIIFIFIISVVAVMCNMHGTETLVCGKYRVTTKFTDSGDILNTNIDGKKYKVASL